MLTEVRAWRCDAGHVDADVIASWLEHVLLPEMSSGDWIVWDGAGYFSCADAKR